MGLRALQLMMGLGRPALESELGRKSTDLRARKRSRAHLKRTHGALQRSFGRRLRGEKPAERRARPDRRSGAHRSAQERRKATRPAQDEPCERRSSTAAKAAAAKPATAKKPAATSAPAPTTAPVARLRPVTARAVARPAEAAPAGTRASGAGRRSPGRGSSRRRSSRASQARAGATTGLGTDLPAPSSARGAALRSKTAGASPGCNRGLGLARTANRPSRAAWGSTATGRSHARPRRQGDGRTGAWSHRAPAAPAAAASSW